MSNNTTLLSKIFRRGSKADASDGASTTSEETLIQNQRMKSTSQEEHETVGDLMSKANTMSEEDFKKYLKEHKEVVEAAYRKQGGGIASGEWISSDYTTGLNP
jgi:hypothetical protein